MTKIDTSKLSWDEWDELQNPPPAVTDFDRVVESAISRRGFLGGVLAFGSAAAALGTLGNLATSTSAQAQDSASRFPFKPVPAATDHTVHVPEGYSWKPLAKWGQPLFPNVPDIDPAKGVSLENSDKVFGENTDGMELFVVGSHQRSHYEVNFEALAEGYVVPEGVEDQVAMERVDALAADAAGTLAEAFEEFLFPDAADAAAPPA